MLRAVAAMGRGVGVAHQGWPGAGRDRRVSGTGDIDITAREESSQTKIVA